MSRSFHEILADLKQGSNERRAQSELYELASAALLEPLRGKIPAKARARLDAEDVLHEAVLRALQNAGHAEFANERQFLAWVYRIARNLMTDQARRMSARALPLGGGGGSTVEPSRPRASRIAGRGHTPESTLQRQESIEQVLGQLRPPEAEVIRRRWLGGESFREIAAALSKTQKAVKGMYTRAWKRFQELARREGR